VIRALFALALLVIPAKASGELVGRTYAEVIRGTDYDPARKAITPAMKEAFTDTLNGPQTPGVIVRVGGRELLVYEACTAHLCAYNRSVTAIDTQTGALYAVVYGDAGKSIVVPDTSIEKMIGSSCDGNRCDFTTVVATGAPVTPEPLRVDDFKGFAGGANCRAFDASGNVVLYTEGKAVIRFQGERHLLAEDGIGTSNFYSVDHEPAMTVTLTDRPGRAMVGYEVSIRPKTLTILRNNRTVTYPVTVKCES
jgi:hypothetical protein